MVDLKIIDGGFAKGTEDKVADQLMEEAIESTLKLVEDQNIFGDTEQEN